MKKQPLISVIVASYNYAKYIKETLDSLIRQTNKSFEVIVVDDGSNLCGNLHAERWSG